MRAKLLMLIAVGCLALTPADGAFAQKIYNRGDAPMGRVPGNPNSGYRGPGFGLPGIILAVPSLVAPARPSIDDNGPPPRERRQQRDTQRRPANRAPATAADFVADEILIRFANPPSAQQITTLQRRYRLAAIDSWTSQLSGITSFRWRVLGGRPVPTVVRALQRESFIASVQPNYLYALLEDGAKLASEGDPTQYERGKLHLSQAHALAKGDNVLVAVIDSGIDAENAELAGSIADSFDALPGAPHFHGTAVAGLIAAHDRLIGAAPNAKILAVRAFDPKANNAHGTTDNIRKGLAWAAVKGARVINMSFAGRTDDPAFRDELAAAHKKGIVLVAAAGNEGASSPKLYPGAYPDVIAVAATNAHDGVFKQSSRGGYVAIAAPGEDIRVVTLKTGGDEFLSGTSMAAPQISGIAALMLQYDPTLTPDRLRDILQKTAKDLGKKGRDPEFGYGLADALEALTAARAPVASTVPLERASTAGSR